MTVSLKFFSQYHSMMVKALEEDAKKTGAKVGSMMIDNWANNTGKFQNNSEFAQSFENYLKELEFAEYIKIYCDEKDYILNIKKCVICHGNEILRREGAQTMCPIIQAAKYAAINKIRKNIITKGVEKSGIIGECTIKFELE